MNILVLFGSKSDAYIYDPLKSQLMANGHSVDFRFLSVHRSPDLLDKELESVQADIVVAGAGLSAHLPGVLASKLLQPVLGIPCAPAFGGLDALLSMVQMPFGIPVLTTAPDQYKTASDFITKWSRLDLRFSEQPVHIIVEKHKVSLPYVDALIQKAKNIANKVNLSLSIQNEPIRDSINILLEEVDTKDPQMPSTFNVSQNHSSLLVHVPVFKDLAYKDPSSALFLQQKMKALGGVWVGANNIGNGFLAGLQLSNANAGYNAALTNAKKGYIHLYG